MKKLAIVLVLFLIVSITTFFVKNKSITGVKHQTNKVEQGAISSSFYTAGTLAYRNQARLSAELVAKVTHIYVQEGQAVEQGQELIKLDDSTVKAEISQMEAQVARGDIEIRRAKNDVEQRQTEWQRQNELTARGMVSKQALDIALNALDNARFQLESNEKNALQNVAALLQKQKLLEKTIIRSPIQGVVIAIPIKVGETAVASAVSLAGSSLMTIADPSSMVVEAQIAEFDIARIKLGQLAAMTTRAVPNETFKGKVTRIARSVNNDSKTASDNKTVRTVAVQIELANSHPQFVSGMSCDLSLIEGAQAKTLLIPLTALRVDEINTDSFSGAKRRDYYVWQVKNGRVVKQMLEIGYADEHRQEVRKGLALGDEIISGPAALLEKLRDGQALPEVDVR
ncbi:efflux RND transporter periplasmic adaptor subunit [Undibacterium seohonense]|uniref:Efflux RND transporter periplasmic adaptor subunit n=1 Tax=Undibacterium seohonense TaxID=1344950 RepID=A0ABR6X6Q4_9BURK|nr:efflux RND transporter periplasmic adaptor subunit [Undibacterium seohonense]MBC3808638.1 efflux RND transporter periplasmic adaptor subunit [Undibacterium seohonense]